MLTLAFNIQPVKASGTIYIRADGSVEPDTAPISSVDNVTYTFTDNIYDEIVVEKSDIIVDGNGYTLQGSGSGYGFDIVSISNVTIQNTNIKNFSRGVQFYSSSNSTLFGSNITNNKYGIVLWDSSNNTLRNNDANNNIYNFGVIGSLLSHFIQDIDDSNTVNGKPVYYWVNRRDMVAPLDAGYVALVNCTRIAVQNLNLANNGQGLLLAFTTNSTITKNSITNNYNSVYLYWSSNYNTISENNITANTYSGIVLDRSSNNTISGNNIKNNYLIGIYLRESNGSTFTGNTISENSIGIALDYSKDNTIYHNSFINNTRQVWFIVSGANFWDDSYPSGGNYWSDYTGVDVKSGPNQDQPSSDGIGDTAYVIDANDVDHYPLMYPWGAPPPHSHTLTIHSSPSGVTFTVDGVSRTTPWSGTYSEDSSVSLTMPEIHSVGDARYYWNQWSDGVTTRPRTVTMDTDITLTAHYTGPHYQLTVTSSPITGIQFIINGTPKTTPYTEWLLEGSYTLIMPETYNGYIWSHWLEDGDPNRIKTITLPETTYTAVYTEPPIGGYSLPIKGHTAEKPLTLYLAIVAILTASFTIVKRRKKQD